MYAVYINASDVTIIQQNNKPLLFQQNVHAVLDKADQYFPKNTDIYGFKVLSEDIDPLIFNLILTGNETALFRFEWDFDVDTTTGDITEDGFGVMMVITKTRHISYCSSDFSD